MLSGAIVHPEQKVVLLFAPEAILKSDGSTKNDCERRSAERFLEHPPLRIIVTGDGLFSNGPFIKMLNQHDHTLKLYNGWLKKDQRTFTHIVFLSLHLLFVFS